MIHRKNWHEKTWNKLWAGIQSLVSTSHCSVTHSCPALSDPMDCSIPGFPVLHHLPEHAKTHVHCVSDAIQPSHPLSSPSSSAFNLFQHQGLSQWVIYLHIENPMKILIMLSYQRTNLLKFKEKLFFFSSNFILFLNFT